MSQQTFEPKLVSIFKEGYKRSTFLKDIVAGITVGIVALPLSIAFAIASGVNPEQGLYTAVIAGLLISVFSGSRVQIGGPTGAFIVIVYDIVQKYGYDGLATATIMAGAMLIVLGLARLGDVIKFIPYPVTVGFTSGIALIIFTVQVKDFMGFSIPQLPEHFLDKWVFYAQHFLQPNIHALTLGLLTIFIILFWPRLTQRVPGPLVALVATTALAHFGHWPVETIGSRFGEVPNTLPAPRIPNINFDIMLKMSSPALTIALLAGVESLLSAVVADGMTGRRHRSNMELIAQGIANLVSPIFSGIPATGAIARTATNIKNGGTTPVAGIIHALTVLILFLFLGKLAALIPMATLAGILIVVAYNMSEWHLFYKFLRSPKSDLAVLLITFLLTVLIDLTVAIEVGVVMAAFLFMRRMIDVTEVNYLTESLRSDDDLSDPQGMTKKKIPPGVEVFEIYGPFFFGATDKFRNTLSEIRRKPKVLILRLRHVPAIDATALHALEDVFERTKKDGTTLILADLHQRPFKILEHAGLAEKIGRENIQPDIDHALSRARLLIKQD